MKLFALLFVLGTTSCCETRGKAEAKCRRGCTEYGAIFVRAPGKGCDENTYECWCRRGVEQGVNSEPLRIW